MADHGEYGTGRSGGGESLGQSESFLQFQEKLSRVARVERPILVLGERGTGKELAARRLHFLSGRWERPFITLHCAALSPTLIESELFGHEKGAFTGAERQRSGRFEAADGGTLFLDEIGSIPMEAQEKILRVVEYGFFERVGSSRPVEVDVRIVGATNADLVSMADEGRFKKDLLDRLSFEVLFLPPLRNRGEDILLLANHFASRMAYELGREDIPWFAEESEAALLNYGWPGNIRELKNVVERAVYSSPTEEIDQVVFDPFISPWGPEHRAEPESDEVAEKATSSGADLRQALAEVEVQMVADALKENRFNQKKTARALGLTYNQLRGIVRKHGYEKLGIH